MQRWNPYETVLGVNNVGGLQLKWKSILGNVLYESNIQSSPAVVNGVVYVGSDSNGNLYRAECQYRRQAVELCHRRRM